MMDFGKHLRIGASCQGEPIAITGLHRLEFSVPPLISGERGGLEVEFISGGQ